MKSDNRNILRIMEDKISNNTDEGKTVVEKFFQFCDEENIETVVDDWFTYMSEPGQIHLVPTREMLQRLLQLHIAQGKELSENVIRKTHIDFMSGAELYSEDSYTPLAVQS